MLYESSPLQDKGSRRWSSLMLFNSYPFILLFLPVVLAGYSDMASGITLMSGIFLP